MIRHHVRHHDVVSKRLVLCDGTPTEMADAKWRHHRRQERHQERLHELYTAAGYLAKSEAH